MVRLLKPAAFLIIFSLFQCVTALYAAPDSLFVDEVWAGHPVGFDVFTGSKFQYVCYYNKERDLVIAQREINSNIWKKSLLPTRTGWDSHNYVRVIVDRKGFIHVSGNMHNVPLVYFRSEKPHDISTLKPMQMTGVNEQRVTYPIFFTDPAENLYFQYRDGQSGEGSTYWKAYDAELQKWSDVFDKPLFDGEKESNAYMSRLTQGPDGYFYMVWMWRLTYIANTNHNLSCVRTKDFRTWETIDGKKADLPLKWSSNAATVDPVGPWNGLINMNFFISWDSHQRACISYHKYDMTGLSQVFVARRETDRWKIYQVSDWKSYTWNLNLGGSLPAGVRPSALTASGDGSLYMDYFHEEFGSGRWTLNPETLTIKKTEEKKDRIGTVSKVNGLNLQPGKATDNTGRYELRWQTLPSNRDRPRELPEPVIQSLYLVQVR